MKNSPHIERYSMNYRLCVYDVLTCTGSFSLTASFHCQVLLLSLETFRTCEGKAFQIRTL
jgi:hypothetical protein